MSESDQNNHWSSLADDLGAPPAPEPEKPPVSDDEPSSEEDSPSDVALPADEGAGESVDSTPEVPPAIDVDLTASSVEALQSTQPSSDWSSLADNLGLPPAPEPPPEPVAADEPEASDEADEPDASEASDEPYAFEESDELDDASEAEMADVLPFEAEPPPRDEPLAFGDVEQPDDAPEESQVARRAASLEFGFGIMATDDTRDQSFIEEAEDAVSEDEEDDDESDTSDADDEYDAAQNEPDDSFDEPEEDTEEDSDEDTEEPEDLSPPEPADESTSSDTAAKSRRRRPRRRRRKRRPTESGADDADQGADKLAASDDDKVSEPDGESGDASEETDAEPREKRGRGRRRRRRPRTEASPDEAASVDATASDDADDDAEDTSEQTDGTADDAAPRRRKPEKPGSPDADEKGEGRPSHRKIPSWEEAIGVIISENMDGRSRSPDSGPRRRGRGKSRGGPRRGKKT